MRAHWRCCLKRLSPSAASRSYDQSVCGVLSRGGRAAGEFGLYGHATPAERDARRGDHSGMCGVCAIRRRHATGSSSHPGGCVPGRQALAVIGHDASEALTSTVERAMKTHVPVVPLVVPGNGELLPHTRRSDHATFWDQGFPTVMVTDTANFRNPHYHLPSDRLDTLDLDFMSQVAHGLVASAKQLAGMDDYAT